MICEQCKRNVGKELRQRVNRVNQVLYVAGLKYYDTLSAAANVVSDALHAEGLFVDYLSVRQMCEGEYRTHAEVGEGKWVTACYHEMPSGRFELVAYVS